MEKIKTIAARGSLVLAGLLWFLTLTGEAATTKLTCSAKDTIGNAVKKLKPGDTLFVSGTCNENLEIPEEITRVVLAELAVNASCDPETKLTQILSKLFGGFPLLRSS